MDREPTPPYQAQVRTFVAERFPALKDAPVIETRVCQYENTETGNYLVDRHPEMENVWIVGGGSGHGFKNGPAMGEYVASVVARGSTRKVVHVGLQAEAGPPGGIANGSHATVDYLSFDRTRLRGTRAAAHAAIVPLTLDSRFANVAGDKSGFIYWEKLGRD